MAIRTDRELIDAILARDETTRGMRGAGMRMLVLEDSDSELEVKVNRELTDKMRLQAGEQLLIAEGRIDKSRGGNGGLAMSARNLYDLDDWLGRRLRRMTVRCRPGADADRVWRHLKVARANRADSPANGAASCEVDIEYDNGQARCRIALGGGWRMNANTIRVLRENPDVSDCRLEYA